MTSLSHDSCAQLWKEKEEKPQPRGEKGKNTAEKMRQEHRNQEEIAMDSGY